MPTGRRPDGQSGGRIHVHSRNTDDTTPIIGADLAIQEAHTSAITMTQDLSMTNKCQVEYRNRIAKIINWVKYLYPTYFEDGTREVSEEELQDPRSFHHKNKRDLHYTGLNVNVLQAFLGANKFKTPTNKNPRTDV